MKQQTAVEWMVERCNQWFGICDGEYIDPEVIEKALEMEKEQITNACVEAGSWGKDSSYSDSSLQAVKEWANDYYQQTYGGDK